MKREDKEQIVEKLSQRFQDNTNFYLADVSALSVNEINEFRKMCYDQGVYMQMVKNTLINKALNRAKVDKDNLKDTLKGPSSLMFSESINAPAKLIKKFRKTHDKPVLKAAYIEEYLYVGDEQLEHLANLKSKEELIGEVVNMLQSPMKNVISGLQSGGNKLAGVVKTLSERNKE